jgi:hypothetical protein
MPDNHKEVLSRIDAIEHEFINGCVTTPDQISSTMIELAGYYAYLSSRITEKEIEKMHKSKNIVGTMSKEAKELGTKVNNTSLTREIEYQLTDLVTDIMSLECKRNNCDKFISVCQSILKSLDREKRLPY